MNITPDTFNALLELIGSILTWRNAWQLWIDREIRGVYWPMPIFFTAWGFWNLYYYPPLNQWLSFYAGLLLVMGNVLWVIMAAHLKYALLTEGNKCKS